MIGECIIQCIDAAGFSVEHPVEGKTLLSQVGFIFRDNEGYAETGSSFLIYAHKESGKQPGPKGYI